MAAVAGIRLDYLSRIIDALKSEKELESIVGSPVDKHIVLLVEDGRFKFNSLTPFGESEKDFTQQQMSRAQQIVDRVIKSNYPGTEDLPGVQ